MKKLALFLTLTASVVVSSSAAEQLNILFAIADDWGWPHAGAYGDAVVKTPNFDRVAREGILFEQAYVNAPSCTPSRNGILTGQWHWRLEAGANLWSTLDPATPTYPLLFQEAGYHVGHMRKSWGPGRLTGWEGRHPAGKNYKNFDTFMAARPDDTPFCFWFGTSDPHRGYKKGSGAGSGMDLSKVHLFPHYPDATEVRSDIADYYWEVQRFDREFGEVLAKLEAAGELDRTLVVITGDHGMPFPRCKGNLYDSGTRVPLALRWPGQAGEGRRIEDFVSLTDLAPTFLEAAGLSVPEVMTGRSLLSLVRARGNGRLEPDIRGHILTGKERHVPAQEAPSAGGYPCRSIRTHQFLYIHNYESDRWPAGTPNYMKAYKPGGWFADCDGGPAKNYIVANKDKDEAHRKSYALCFAKRPAEELYDLSKDPDQLVNVAGQPEYASIQQQLAEQLTCELKASGDLRVIGRGAEYEKHPYFGGGGGKHPDYKPARKASGKKGR